MLMSTFSGVMMMKIHIDIEISEERLRDPEDREAARYKNSLTELLKILEEISQN